ncbi:MAG: motility associated factor glycosyltransferase family protein [Solirubrobacterales bacterium]
MTVNSRKIEFVDTTEGNKTIKSDNMFIHSKYSPTKEAVTFLDNNKIVYNNKSVVVVYGMGLGYHIIELLKRIKADSKVYVFDMDDELFNIAKSYEVVKEVLNDIRIKFYCGYTKENLKEFSMKLQLVDDILLFKPAFNCIANKYSEFKNIIEGYELGKNGIKKYENIMKDNEMLNENLNCESMEAFFNKHNFSNETVIIVSAGPSLDSNIEKLKFACKKAKIFVVGSALKALLANGVNPDMICIIDSAPIIQNQIKGCGNLSIPLCFLSSASNLAISSYNGPKFIFYNEKKENNIIIDTGKSVATAILSIAIKGQAKKIIFVGQDLAYLNNKSHCDQYAHDNSIPGNGAFKYVKGVNGTLLETTDVLLYFKHWIEKTIEQNGGIEYINCSDGAIIEGTKKMDLLDALAVI